MYLLSTFQLVDEKQGNWKEFLGQACWAIRSSYNEATKRTPYEIMFLRKPRFATELAISQDEQVIIDSTPTTAVDDYFNVKQSQASQLHKVVTIYCFYRNSWVGLFVSLIVGIIIVNDDFTFWFVFYRFIFTWH